MKFFKSGAVIFLLGVFPLASWYFLQSGLDWRIDKRILLEPKVALTEIISDQASLDSYRYKTTLLQLSELDQEKEAVVKDQFKNAYTFQWRTAPNDIAASYSLVNKGDYLLIDTALQVRRIYVGAADSVYAQMVEDLSLVIPRKKELDIKMKNSKGDE